MLSQTTAWTVAAAGVGLCFIGYCIYFDRKRRSDPFFRQKLRESTHVLKAKSIAATNVASLYGRIH